MKKRLISVIIPVYNVEDFLPRCIDSAIKQTYENLEIFLVDDGSTDASGRICDEYKKKDNRIKVIHKRNGGLSDARNVAIDSMKGDYVFFLDSDDYMSEETISLLYKCMIDNEADIVTTQYIEFSGEDYIESDRAIVSKDCITLSNKDALENLMYQKDCKTSAWGKLYKASLFDNIRYPKGKICEDLPTTYLLFAKASKICLGIGKLYYYNQRQGSIINSSFNTARMDALGFAEEETEFIKNNFEDILNSAICREFLEAIYILIKLYGCSGKYKREYKKVKESLKKNRGVVLFDRKAPMQYRLCAMMCFISIKMTQVMLFLRNKRSKNV